MRVEKTRVPRRVLKQVEDATRNRVTRTSLFTEGAKRRTWLAESENGSFALRFATAPSRRIRRVVQAQRSSHDAGGGALEVLAARVGRIFGYEWVLEPLTAGLPFRPDLHPEIRPCEVARDLGRHLRRQHAVAIDRFGRLESRDRFDQPCAWTDAKFASFDKAMALTGIGRATADRLRELKRRYRESFAGSPVLVHGDFGGRNLRVEATQLVAVIDWDNARGGDPAEDFARLWSQHPDSAFRSALLDGYDVRDRAGFVERIRVAVISRSIRKACIDARHGKVGGVAAARQTMEQILDA